MRRGTLLLWLFIATGMAAPCLAQYGPPLQPFDPTDPEAGVGFTVHNYPGYGFYPGYGGGFGGFAPQAAAAVTSQALLNENTITALEREFGQQFTREQIRTALHRAVTPTVGFALREATAKDPSGNDDVNIQPEITHQPLIHIKVRVIEVNRTNGLAYQSVLNYISRGTSDPSLTNGNPLNAANNGHENFSSVNRFTPIPGLVNGLNNGSGLLVNLTTEHINWVAGVLANEFNADIVTAPQVTTLNGKNVIFRSGAKVPFELGQNTIADNTTNIQQFFYKHVGVFISVTPQIVNWGEKHEGLGRVRADYRTEWEDLEHLPVEPSEVRDFRGLLHAMQSTAEIRGAVTIEFRDGFLGYDVPAEITEQDKARALWEINRLVVHADWPRSRLSQVLYPWIALPPPPLCSDCEWRATDCTINLNISARLSDDGKSNVTVINDNGAIVEKNISAEQNVRAISNVVQVKSGHGVVIGGLIGMSDEEETLKVPVLGDLPVIGAAFRSRTVNRVKQETLIFVEATVLPPLDAMDEYGNDAIEGATKRDFCHGQFHLIGEICDGPLSYGLHRAGLLGDYLPPPSHGELEYWRTYLGEVAHKRRHTISQQALDIFEGR